VDAEAQTVPLIGRDGKLQGVAGIFRDLSRTSRRPLEYRQLKLAASRDPLTSVANRGELETQLTLLVNEFAEKPKAEPFSVIFLDLDHFKSINDTYGHSAGDQVLIETARLMQHETYSGELVGRYGGEEFIIICPSTNLQQAKKRAERLRQTISRKEIAQLSGNTITSSFGVAQIEAGDSVASLLRRADRALYISKEMGRNRTTTLTNAEYLNGAMPMPEQAVAKDGPYIYQTTFHACVAAELIVSTLGGFGADQKAKLVDANAEEATLHLGAGGMLGGWGNTDEKQPITLHVRFASKKHGKKSKEESSRQSPVEVTIRPRGRVPSLEVFQSRSKRVVKSLRAYFVAD
jgi:diguanylate cyclase (GGDEF)-like protein